MENLNDVDYQAIVGTHGTGDTLGNLSSTLVGGTLVTGTGELVRFGEENDGSAEQRGVDGDDLCRAAQVSLGVLGVLTSLTLRVVPSYELHRRNWITAID